MHEDEYQPDVELLASSYLFVVYFTEVGLKKAKNLFPKIPTQTKHIINPFKSNFTVDMTAHFTPLGQCGVQRDM
jgi:hypothetical protein